MLIILLETPNALTYKTKGVFSSLKFYDHYINPILLIIKL